MLAAALSEQDLLKHHADSLLEEREVYWDSESGSVKARRVTRLGALILKQTTHERATSEETESVLLKVIAAEGPTAAALGEGNPPAAAADGIHALAAGRLARYVG